MDNQELLVSGMTYDEILTDYKDLEKEDFTRLLTFCCPGYQSKKYKSSCGMKFLIDAQLPKKLGDYLNEKEFDVIHTLDLPKDNSTQDAEFI